MKTRRHVAAVAALAAVLAAGPAQAKTTIRDLPVAFDVVNTASSDARCVTDGATYTVAGTLVGPKSALRRDAAEAVTLYLHGFGVPGSMFRPQAVPGYDLARELGARGHVSLVVDQLGWGRSGIPHGYLVCAGAYADHAGQLVRALRSGGYSAAGRPGPAFRRVAVAGFSMGAGVAEIVAAAREVDALVSMSNPGFGEASGEFGEVALESGKPCSSGGREKREGAPRGYQDPFLVHHAGAYHADADPALVQEMIAAEERGPCGVGGGLAQEALARELAYRRVSAPVLVVQGGKDRLWKPGSGERAADRFSASPDVTYLELPGSGHVITIEREAPLLHERLSAWLGARGL